MGSYVSRRIICGKKWATLRDIWRLHRTGPTILSLYTSFCFLKASRFSRVANSQTVKLGLCSLSILVSQSSAVLLRFYCKFDLLSAELVDSVLLPSIPITKVVHNKASCHYRVGQNLIKERKPC